MGKYFLLYETYDAFSAEQGSKQYVMTVKPGVAYTKDNQGVFYNKTSGWEYVDLGLPSNTLWATCNVGASSPEEYGDFYAWGEVETKNETAYTDEGYRFHNGNESEYSKYNSTDNKMTLDLEDDAANVVMGGNWHMPSKAQLLELSANTTTAWTNDYNGTGVAGAILTSKNNGNSIFFPAAGEAIDDAAAYQGVVFSVWSSSLGPGSNSAWGLAGSSDVMDVSTAGRFTGLSVRGVLGELND